MGGKGDQASVRFGGMTSTERSRLSEAGGRGLSLPGFWSAHVSFALKPRPGNAFARRASLGAWIPSAGAKAPMRKPSNRSIGLPRMLLAHAAIPQLRLLLQTPSARADRSVSASRICARIVAVGVRRAPGNACRTAEISLLPPMYAPRPVAADQGVIGHYADRFGADGEETGDVDIAHFAFLSATSVNEAIPSPAGAIHGLFAARVWGPRTRVDPTHPVCHERLRYRLICTHWYRGWAMWGLRGG
jgi:hypothetical protein